MRRATEECGNREKRLQTTAAFLLCSEKRKIICVRVILFRLVGWILPAAGTGTGVGFCVLEMGDQHETHLLVYFPSRVDAFRIRHRYAGVRELQLFKATERHLLVHLCR